MRSARTTSGAFAPFSAPRPLWRRPKCASAAGVVRSAVEVQDLTFRAAVSCVPHPAKVETGGEDAHFISNDCTALGVADGVGGWNESGINPGDYSRSIMRTAAEYLNSDVAKTLPASQRDMEERAREALAIAHQKTRLPGSSTACIVTLHPHSRFLSAVNLGDSSFVVVRKGTVVFQAGVLQHFFDCPLQLGAYPEYVETTDYPTDAATYSLNVNPGDAVVLASDGLWDNCTIEEIVQLLPDDAADVENAAASLAAAARKHAEDPEFDSPYAAEARKNGMELPLLERVTRAKIVDGQLQLGRIVGGKMDDITVVVGLVVEKPETAEASEAAAAGVPVAEGTADVQQQPAAEKGAPAEPDAREPGKSDSGPAS